MCVSEQQPPVHVCDGCAQPLLTLSPALGSPHPKYFHAFLSSVCSNAVLCRREASTAPAPPTPTPTPSLVSLQSSYPRNPEAIPGPDVSSYLFCEFGLLLQGQVYQFVSHAGLLLPLGELGRVTESKDVISGQRGYGEVCVRVCVCLSMCECACACVFHFYQVQAMRPLSTLTPC